ncbi:site-specific DNA-methyltransferase [Pseudomonas koreensis]|nr:site-specific DNA-methyltransferase [Pseudomonas koreensis]
MENLKMHSLNITQDNISRIRDLFPGCVTEAKGEDGGVKLAVDFDQLRQELADSIVEGPQERYNLNWPGKREAMLTANAPIAKTLRPCQHESVDFDNTKNLFIEGDNLDALKLLQETYLGKVKMIYIDPPYNTGNDFIYEDDFAEETEGYLQRSNQKDDEGNKLVANTASNGRFHSDWCSMMYSRLRLARNLLSENGVIFISLDDGELANLRKICDEIFGEDKLIATFIWKSRQNKDNRSKNGASVDHEYVLAYGKSIRGSDRDLTAYSNPDGDSRGDWTSANMVGLATADRRPNLHYDLIDPATGINYGRPPMGWRYDRNTMAKLIAENKILWPAASDGRPRKKAFVQELGSEQTGYSSIIGKDIYTRNGTSDIEALFGSRVMDFPKPVSLLEELIKQANVDSAEIVLDFFSGSATTAHAVLKLNAADGKNRRFVMVQLPQHCDDTSEASKAGYGTIADMSKERIRRAGQSVIDAVKVHENWNKDVGFRAFKIDTSNMADVYYAPDAMDKAKFDLFVDNIKLDRTPADLLFQVMLDWGIDLALPITNQPIQGKDVFFVDGNVLAACFDASGSIDEAFVKELAKQQPLRVVFRDAGYRDSSVKINVEQIFKLLSPATEVKCI